MNRWNARIALAAVVGFGSHCAGAPPPPPTSPTGLPDRSVLGGGGASPVSIDARGSSGDPTFGDVREDRWDAAMDGLATALAQRLRWEGQARMKVAVLDFIEANGAACTLGSPAAEDLTTSLFNTNKFEIIERRMLDRVLKENQASQSDLFDPEHVAKLGGLLGADGIVTGTVTASRQGYTFNTRVILAESGGVASAARMELSRTATDGRGTCGDARQVIAAPPPHR
jgi:TolB-like protein